MIFPINGCSTGYDECFNEKDRSIFRKVYVLLFKTDFRDDLSSSAPLWPRGASTVCVAGIGEFLSRDAVVLT